LTRAPGIHRSILAQQKFKPFRSVCQLEKQEYVTFAAPVKVMLIGWKLQTVNKSSFASQRKHWLTRFAALHRSRAIIEWKAGGVLSNPKHVKQPDLSFCFRSMMATSKPVRMLCNDKADSATSTIAKASSSLANNLKFPCIVIVSYRV